MGGGGRAAKSSAHHRPRSRVGVCAWLCIPVMSWQAILGGCEELQWSIQPACLRGGPGLWGGAMTNPQNTNYEPLGRRWWEGGRGRRGKAGPGVSSPSQLLGCPHAIPGKETYGDPDSPQENYTPAGSMVPPYSDPPNIF